MKLAKHIVGLIWGPCLRQAQRSWGYCGCSPASSALIVIVCRERHPELQVGRFIEANSPTLPGSGLRSSSVQQYSCIIGLSTLLVEVLLAMERKYVSRLVPTNYTTFTCLVIAVAVVNSAVFFLDYHYVHMANYAADSGV